MDYVTTHSKVRAVHLQDSARRNNGLVLRFKNVRQCFELGIVVRIVLVLQKYRDYTR